MDTSIFDSTVLFCISVLLIVLGSVVTVVSTLENREFYESMLGFALYFLAVMAAMTGIDLRYTTIDFALSNVILVSMIMGFAAWLFALFSAIAYERTTQRSK